MSLLRKARIESGMTTVEAAEKLNIGSGYLSQIENGKRQVDRKRANELAALYGKTVEELFVPAMLAVRKEFDCEQEKV